MKHLRNVHTIVDNPLLNIKYCFSNCFTRFCSISGFRRHIVKCRHAKHFSNVGLTLVGKSDYNGSDKNGSDLEGNIENDISLLENNDELMQTSPSLIFSTFTNKLFSLSLPTRGIVSYTLDSVLDYINII